MVEATVTLYKDIGIYPDYKRTMLFDTKTQQNNWFDAITVKKTVTANYNKLQNSFVLHEDVGNVYQYTYVRIKNLDSSGRYYYGFVSNVTLVDEENTQFDIALDPIQTFMCEWELGECLVMREHCNRWTKNSSAPLRITPNSEPVTAYTETVTNSQSIITSDVSLNIIAITLAQTYWDSVAQIKVDEKNSSRIMFLAIPFYPSSIVPRFMKVKARKDTNTEFEEYALNLPTAREVMNGSVPSRIGINPESVIGSWIVPCHDLTIVESRAKRYGTESTVDTVNVLEISQIITHEGVNYDTNTAVLAIGSGGLGDLVNSVYGIQVFNNEQIKQVFNSSVNIELTDYLDKPTKPTSATTTFSDTYEPALYMAPYRRRGIISNCASLLEIPDNIFLKQYTYLHKRLICSTSGVSQELFVDNSSGITTESRNSTALMGSFGKDLNIAGDILSNEWLSYCLTSRQSDRDSVKSQIISNTITNMVGMGYGGALVGSRANSGQNDRMKGEQGNSIPISRAGGFGRAMMSASAFGMATGLVTSAVQGWDMWNQQMAKESSIKNQPSQLTVSGDGYVYCLDDNYEYKYYETKVDDNTYETAVNNFRYYGYIVNRVEVPNIKSRYYYNYICTLNTTIKGSLSADIKQAIATIFEKGITFFHADHCNTTEYNNYENIERSLL